jgi:uncharacterized protein (TIGR02996 family)
MTADERALIQAIIANPDDDLPRLVYADWLEEHGRPERAEFIRVQCELARVGFDPVRRRRLQKQARQLLHRYGERWRGELPSAAPAEWGEYERGLMNSICITLSPTAGLPPADVFEATPLRVVSVAILQGDHAEVTKFLNWSGLRRFERVTVTGLAAYPAESSAVGALVRAIVGHEWGDTPAVLDLSHCWLGWQHWQTLADVPKGRRMPRLIPRRWDFGGWEVREQLRERYGVGIQL